MPNILKKLLRLIGARNVQHVVSLFTVMVDELRELRDEQQIRVGELNKKIIELESKRAVALADARKADDVAGAIRHLTGEL